MTVVPDKLLVILPTDGHGGCEYNALSVAQFAQDRLGIAVLVAFPMRRSTAFLSELCTRNGLATIDLAIGFDADDDAGRLADQAEAAARLLLSATPDVVFLAMPWPARCGASSPPMPRCMSSGSETARCEPNSRTRSPARGSPIA